MKELYNGDRIIMTRSDMCHQCRKRVDWLQVQTDGGFRFWHAVEFATYPHQPHTCLRSSATDNTYQGPVCKRGHDGERYRSGGNCVTCAKESAAKSRKKLPIAISLLMLSGCTSLPQVNQGAQYVFQVANIVDTIQTVHGAASDSCYAEADPITRRLIGEHPSATAVVAKGVGYALVQYGVGRWLSTNGHEYLNTAWQALTIESVGSAVANNIRVGIRIGAPNTDQGYQRECVHR